MCISIHMFFHQDPLVQQLYRLTYREYEKGSVDTCITLKDKNNQLNVHV